MWNTRENIIKHRRNEQKILLWVSFTKRAHQAQQLGAPRKMHALVNTRAHLSACQRAPGEAHQGATNPLGQPNLDGLPSRCILGWSGSYSTFFPWIRLPCIGTRGVAPTPPLPLYKGASSSLSYTTHSPFIHSTPHSPHHLGGGKM
jgi:hypothetical protein